MKRLTHQELRKKLWYRLFEVIVIIGYSILGIGMFGSMIMDGVLNIRNLLIGLAFLGVLALIIWIVRMLILYVIYGGGNNERKN